MLATKLNIRCKVSVDPRRQLGGFYPFILCTMNHPNSEGAHTSSTFHFLMVPFSNHKVGLVVSTLKIAQHVSCELDFIWGQMRTAA